MYSMFCDTWFQITFFEQLQTGLVPVLESAKSASRDNKYCFPGIQQSSPHVRKHLSILHLYFGSEEVEEFPTQAAESEGGKKRRKD